VIELHAWRSPEIASFATFIYEKAAERLLRHFTGSDENKSSVKLGSGAMRILEV